MDLLAELRGLFNAPTMTDQQALERVRTLSASTATGDLATANQTIASLRSEVATANTTIGQLKTQIPKALDEEVRAERMIRVGERAESLAASGTCTPADSKGLLTDMVGMKFDADGKLDVAASKIDDVMLARAPGATDCRAAVILGRVATWKLPPRSGHDQAFAQQRMQQQQGGGGAGDKTEEQKAIEEGRNAGAAFQKTQLHNRGVNS
jgi:hypothetical protein